MAIALMIGRCTALIKTDILAHAQTFMAGYAPAPVFAAMSGVAAVGAILCAMRNFGKLSDHGTSQAVWQLWIDLLGVAGVGLLVQARSLEHVARQGAVIHLHVIQCSCQCRL